MSSKSNSVMEKSVNLLLILGCVILVVGCSYIALRNPYLWFDESGQFWIAKGLNHYSDVYAASGGFHDMIESNRHFNLDPGGFSALLYGWLLVCDDSTLFLRLLPFAFFVGFAVCSFLYIYKVRQRVIEAFAFTVLFFFWEVTACEMGEVRGYSMEMFGVISTMCLLPLCIRGHRPYLSLFLLGLWVAVFCTSRYDFIVFALGVSLWLLMQLFLEREAFLKFFLKAACYGLPLLAVTLFIAVFMLSQQDPAGSASSYLYLGASAHAWISPLFLFSVLNTFLIIIRIRKGQSISSGASMFLFVFGVYVLLSLLRVYPIDVRGSMALTVILTFSLGEQLLALIEMTPALRFLLLLALIQVDRTTGLSDIGSLNLDTKTLQTFTTLKDSTSSDKKIFIDYWFNPDIRYLYEYGCLKASAERDGYPERFCLQIDDNDPKQVLMPGDVACDYYVITRFSKFTKDYDLSLFHLLNEETTDVYVRNQ